MAYKQNGQRETDITKAVDVAMEASISYYDALAGASAMHQNAVYAQVCNAYTKVQQAHKAFLASINVTAVELSVKARAEQKREKRLQQYRECAKRKRLGLTKESPLPRGGGEGRPKKVLDSVSATV